MFNAARLRKMKRTAYLVCTARGGIIDEVALHQALVDGTLPAAALDVFDKEPTTESVLFGIDGIVVTPHLGASTTEAQDRAGLDIADQILLALSGDFVPYAVNISAADANETLKPYLPLAERLGRLFSDAAGDTKDLEIIATGEIAGYDTRILTLSALKGFFSMRSDEAVTFVNAPQVAQAQGIEVKESKVSAAAANSDYVNLVTLRAGSHAIAGTLVGPRRQARIVMVDEHGTDVPPSNHMLVVRNDDRPGVIGLVGTLLGRHNVNIADMDVGRADRPGTALMVIAPTAEVPEEVLEELRGQPGIIEVRALRA
jgi:D-3-phosphoglycerate dehydrogenase